MANTALFPPTVDSGVLYIPASAGIDSTALQVVRDCVSGYRGDYIVFSYSDSETVLILSDSLIYEEGVFSCQGFSAFDVVIDSNSQIVSRSISGNLAGVVGADPASLDFSGAFDSVQTFPSEYTLYFDSFDTDIMVSNTNHGVLYSSCDGFAHLHSDSDYSLYFISYALALFGVTALIMSIFKRVK